MGPAHVWLLLEHGGRGRGILFFILVEDLVEVRLRGTVVVARLQ